MLRNTHLSYERLFQGFYADQCLGDIKNRSFKDMIEMSNHQLEKSHDIIQWLFPLDEPSLHNPNAPLLNKALLEEINSKIWAYAYRSSFEQAWKRFMFFLRSAPDDWGMFSKEAWEMQKPYEGKPQWITPRNHNYLRITRVIKSATLFGRKDLATLMYQYACEKYEEYPGIIGTTTKQFWDNAILPIK